MASVVTLPVSLDYEAGFEVLLRAGQFVRCHPSITAKHFRPQRRGLGRVSRDALLVKFGMEMLPEHVLLELAREGCRVGDICELLTLGTQHPKEQRMGPIVALGSVWVNRFGTAHVPYLYYICQRRGIRPGLNDHWWSAQCRFLAFSQDPS